MSRVESLVRERASNMNESLKSVDSVTAADEAKMSVPMVSVCILAWNNYELTAACVKSILKLTRGVSYEIILVDNGSTDGTAQKISESFPAVKILRNEVNQGFTTGNNQALHVASGRYSILLNNDMLFESDALSKMAHYMDLHPDVGVLGCRLRYPDRRVQMTAHADIDWYDHLFHSLYLNRIFPKNRIF